MFTVLTPTGARGRGLEANKIMAKQIEDFVKQK